VGMWKQWNGIVEFAVAEIKKEDERIESVIF
jgi:hypothetical protein